MKIVQLSGKPSLTDIPGRLRWLAGEIEANRIESKSAIVLLPISGDYPRIYGYGDVEGENHPVIQLEMAKTAFILNVMRR